MFSMPELTPVLKKAKDHKAPGEDRIPYEFYKNWSANYLEKLLDFYKKVCNRGEVPENFRKSIVFPIHKKGNLAEVQNYRGIAFGNIIAKVFTGLLLGRLNAWIEEEKILKEFQTGFRASYSTIDNIFTLANIVQIKLCLKRHKVFAFLLTFQRHLTVLIDMLCSLILSHWDCLRRWWAY